MVSSPELCCSNKATQLGPQHRKLIAITELVWPILKPLWQPASHHSYFAIRKLIMENYEEWQDLLPAEVLSAAFLYGRAALVKDSNLQRDTLKHFFNPWWNWERQAHTPAWWDFTRPCRTSDGIYVPAFKEQVQQLDEGKSLSPQTHGMSYGDYVRCAAEEYAEVQNFWMNEMVHLQLRWGIHREAADCLLDVAVKELIEQKDEPLEDPQCAICYRNSDPDKYATMQVSYGKIPQAFARRHEEKSDPPKSCRSWLGAEKTLWYSEKVHRCAPKSSCKALPGKVGGALRMAGLKLGILSCRQCAVTSIVNNLESELNMAVAYLDEKTLAEPDLCGPLVRLTCCNGLFCLDCIREEFTSESRCPYCRHTFHAEKVPTGDLKKPMMRFLDGSWIHKRTLCSKPFLPGADMGDVYVDAENMVRGDRMARSERIALWMDMRTGEQRRNAMLTGMVPDPF